MRERFHEHLDSFAATLAILCESSGTAMREATVALLRADLELAEKVIDDVGRIDQLALGCEENAFTLLALQAPVAGELRQIVGGVHIVADIGRMGGLARHVAQVTRRRHPDQVLPDDVRTEFAEMGRVAVAMAATAGDVLAGHDPERAAGLDLDDEAIDEMQSRLLVHITGPAWEHGVQAAIDVTLLARYYERYADHAVQVGRRVVYLVTGSNPPGSGALR
ncbi:phosphate signaling complex protein PhoU [Antrihabitans cavernicola]|uniref:Phosphate-specific transport system accessory protein PhoU n=1 Tax=Antrihabitans cavernicola TaxID=2495913 RepID=A0A5A7S3T5_9NOCA|nr:phosphate signaling complex protein PhoU [Spelaeibacter cavernicola]KAA0015871.1 phosphate signaling complex protein PhoU [Spelaeibacter cavernicola]